MKRRAVDMIVILMCDILISSPDRRQYVFRFDFIDSISHNMTKTHVTRLTFIGEKSDNIWAEIKHTVFI